MDYLASIFIPTGNRRLNELIGFLMCVFALLLFLALVSYSPLDPSWNSASVLTGSHAARNWIGVVGAFTADMMLQFFGVGAFLLVIFPAMLGARWFRSMKVQSPLAKSLGGIWLVMFIPAMLALLPGQLRWQNVIPIEGLLGRVVGDVLIHYLNIVGAYIVCGTVLAVALYLSTAFSFAAIQLWAPTRFAFVTALWNRYKDWQQERTKKRQQKQLEQRRISKPVVKTQLIPSRPATQAPAVPEPRRTGIERMLAEEEAPQSAHATGGILPESLATDGAPESAADPEVTERADSAHKAKTTMPRIAAGGYKLPSSSLLQRPDEQQAVDADELKVLAQVLTEKYAEFEIHGQVTQINPGPVVTTFEFKPEAGIKYSRITNLCDDLCLALKAESILIERMAGKSTVGIQVPNRQREIIWLRENIESQEFMGSKSKMTIAMGKDINGRIVTADLAGMPHLLIAGSTGAGKSVAINAMIMSILYKATPDQVRLILVDPKRLELGNYEGVPHLYTPIITEPKLAANALRNAVREMERRLKLLAAKGVRNIDQYNKLFDQTGTPSLFDEEGDEKPIPYIVIIIDELADLMMLDSHNVEESITRLAQMARAVGIHLVLATQRPSVDVITGLIKANFPARGVTSRLQCGVKRVLFEGPGRDATGPAPKVPEATGVELRSGEQIAADHVILAVPQNLVLGLLPDEWHAAPQLARIEKLDTAPISSVHLWFDRPITSLRHAVFVSRLSQWLFNRSAIHSSEIQNPKSPIQPAPPCLPLTKGGNASGETASVTHPAFRTPHSALHYYQVVISASRDVQAMGQDETIRTVVEELGAVWPEARAARLVHSRLVTEHKAVVSMLPGVDRLRPVQQSPITNVQLAGDWTSTGWPGTMEGAVRSGYLAAENVLRQCGQCEALVQPDLPRALLSKLLFGL